MAHFHYTIMGGLIFTFFAAIYYWVPKMTGYSFNERLARWHFWLLFMAFNSTFMPLFVLGIKGMPRRVITYASNLQGLNDWVSISAFFIGVSMLIFLWNTIRSLIVVRMPARQPVAIEVAEWQVPTPVPSNDFVEMPDDRLRPLRIRHPPIGHGGAEPTQREAEIIRRWRRRSEVQMESAGAGIPRTQVLWG